MRGDMFQIRTGEQIAHHELREEFVPKAGASWHRIVPFASTFNPAEQMPGYKPVAIGPNVQGQDLSTFTLTDLRAALFFEYRRYNHRGYDPDAGEMVHLHALVEEIRKRIESGEHLPSAET